MKGKFEEENNLGDGVSWWRGKLLGEGGFASVYLAKLKKNYCRKKVYPPLMAVKSAEFSESNSLQNEKEVFNNLCTCPYILKCYGEETTFDKNGYLSYNVLLEYASGGTLAALIKQSGGCGLPESDVKRYTRCILQGIDYIHRHSYVHCDLKPENVLLVAIENDGFVPKIADFGLAKKVLKNNKRRKMTDSFIGGTVLYMAPETLIDHIQESPCDIWALGCIVFEMLTGKRVWDSKPEAATEELIKRIGDRFELPVIPSEISQDGKDFLKRCLVKKPAFRFTSEMLLDHPFMSGLDDSKSSDFKDISDEGCVSNADNEFDDSSYSEDWSTSKDSSLEESDDRSHCSSLETIGLGDQGWPELQVRMR
ncbi:mitogen-activated protein kinase kinase kinase 20 [Ricinus communis]|uniref:mitogen-activated protein kinase kinase kinase 20 n=1 Tax=Ricinus communis TaxID=3988 RepID=UPI00201AEDD5|nr:mitogen-activated protein kinase kinase kinase 20 [Ricinus communis]